ncbi:MAG: arabinan endo-1,5-alpha-L-arabinosidase, partial [Planctomycetota bacterium]
MSAGLIKNFTAVCYAVMLTALAIGASCRETASFQTGPNPEVLELEGNLRVHDPAVIRQADTFYLFSTGGRRRGPGIIPIRCSKDLFNWTLCGSVFDKLPEWVTKEIPGARGAWAPDISFYNGKYHLYYSVSRFGRNDSAIGLATNQTLDPNDPDYKWIDKGLVVRSYEGKDNFNAIDANLVIEDKRNIWLCWGSFWSGIKMRRVDPETGKLSAYDTTLYSLASRPGTNSDRTPSTKDAVEAPFIIYHDGYWYLFVSFDFCCRGAKSTYKVMVGRCRPITGPYKDRSGRLMTDGGGKLVIEAARPNWRGPGHPAVLQESGGDFLLFHAYNGQTGRSELKISTIVWEDGWPRVGELP